MCLPRARALASLTPSSHRDSLLSWFSRFHFFRTPPTSFFGRLLALPLLASAVQAMAGQSAHAMNFKTGSNLTHSNYVPIDITGKSGRSNIKKLASIAGPEFSPQPKQGYLVYFDYSFESNPGFASEHSTGKLINQPGESIMPVSASSIDVLSNQSIAIPSNSIHDRSTAVLSISTFSYKNAPIPYPMPAAGAASAFSFMRLLRRRSRGEGQALGRKPAPLPPSSYLTYQLNLPVAALAQLPLSFSYDIATHPAPETTATPQI